MRSLALSIAAIAASLCLAPPAGASLPPVRHVFVVVLENKNYDESFGPNSVAPYLSKELTAKGQLLEQYYGTSHNSLGNYISLVSGQAANPQTQADCQIFTDMLPGVVGGDGQAIGSGCVYPKGVPSLPDQLDAKGLSWKGYMQDMGKPCRHPAIGQQDPTQSAKVGDQYAARHNPFVYFHSIIDDTARCNAGDVPLESLPVDLASASTTPSFSLIVPDLCEDGHDAPCVDGRPGGLQSADAFLQRWVPEILAAPAMRHGMLIVTWDEANLQEASACCGEQTGPNTPMPGIVGPGGGRTGTIVISPYVQPGTRNQTPYNHYSLLRSVEDLFGLQHLGFAASKGLKPFGSDVFGASPQAGTEAVSRTGSGTSAPATGCTARIAVQRRAGGRARLVVRSPRAGTLRAAGQTRRVRACRSVRMALAGRHGSARVLLPGERRAHAVSY
jgi:phosphatidylinositol-3-phosphatase